MTQPQPGWYPDPADPARQRYWAGDSWTAETRNLDAAHPLPPAPPVDPYANYAAGATGAPQPVGATPYYQGPVGAVQLGPTTLDGVPLASFGWRLLAWILDGLLMGIIGMVVAYLMPGLVSGMQHYLTDVFNTATSGGVTAPSMWDPTYGIAKALLLYQTVALVINCLYIILMLSRVGATVGQLACGLRVVPVDQGQRRGGLPMPNVIMRLLFFTLLPTALNIGSMAMLSSSNTATSSAATLVSMCGMVYLLLAGLWVAWDPKRQGLHDKFAHTQVVRPLR